MKMVNIRENWFHFIVRGSLVKLHDVTKVNQELLDICKNDNIFILSSTDRWYFSKEFNQGLNIFLKSYNNKLYISGLVTRILKLDYMLILTSMRIAFPLKGSSFYPFTVLVHVGRMCVLHLLLLYVLKRSTLKSNYYLRWIINFMVALNMDKITKGSKLTPWFILNALFYF